MHNVDGSASARATSAASKAQTPRTVGQSGRNRTPCLRTGRVGISPRTTTSPRWVSASTSGVFVEELTSRIRRLEGELERAVAAVHRRQGLPVPTQEAVEEEPAVPETARVLSGAELSRGAHARVSMVLPLADISDPALLEQGLALLDIPCNVAELAEQEHPTPELVPEPLDYPPSRPSRMSLASPSAQDPSTPSPSARGSLAARMAAQAVSQVAEEYSAPRSPAQVLKMCQLMQLEWNELISSIQDACDRCSIQMQPPGDESPRQLVSSLADAYLAASNQPDCSVQKVESFDVGTQTDGHGHAGTTSGGGSRHERSAISDLSLLSVSISAADAGSPGLAAKSELAASQGGDMAGVPIGGPSNYPFAAAATSLRSLLAGSSTSSGSGPSQSHPSNAFLALPEAARFDLLDLVVAARRAEPLLMEATVPEGAGRVPYVEAEFAGPLGTLMNGRSSVRDPQPLIPQGVAAIKTRSGRTGSLGGFSDSRPSTQRLRVSWAEDALPDESHADADDDGIFPLRSRKTSSTSSCGVETPVSRLCELISSKEREVATLQSRRDATSQLEEHAIDDDDSLTAAKEELRLLREYAGIGNTGAT